MVDSQAQGSAWYTAVGSLASEMLRVVFGARSATRARGGFGTGLPYVGGEPGNRDGAIYLLKRVFEQVQTARLQELHQSDLKLNLAGAKPYVLLGFCEIGKESKKVLFRKRVGQSHQRFTSLCGSWRSSASNRLFS